MPQGGGGEIVGRICYTEGTERGLGVAEVEVHQAESMARATEVGDPAREHVVMVVVVFEGKLSK